MNKSDRARRQPLDELQDITSRMMAAEETLRAILSGEVDGLVVSAAEGDRVFTLSGAEHPYRVMVETMNEGAATLASDGTILFCNQRFADIVKGSLEKVIGSSIYHYVSSTDLPLFEALVERGLKGNSQGELALQAGGKNSVPVLFSVSTLQHTDVPDAVCAVIVDITELKKMEEALKSSETRYRRLFEAARDGILILDAETGQIVEVNPFLLEILGYSREELLGKKLWEIGTFRDIEESKATSAELKSKGYVRYDDLPLVTKEGRQIAVEFVSNVYLVNHHEVIQCNIRDTTERKLTAEALKKSHSELERQAVELRTALSEIKTMKDQLEAENIYFRHENKIKHRFEQILGQSDGLKYALYRAEQVAPMNTTVLILGETGTGKELIAFAIHDMSPRKDRSLITVNCAALPGNLIESELFGREKGAFTGADTRQVGRFEIAHGSTLCLDEIGELPLEVQAKLLRVIQHNEFERLGSSNTVKVDVRIIATTNRDLEEEVRKGRFRQDLYYRLNVFPITVPPLRQRKEDIPLMVQAFMERYSKKVGKKITSIEKETMKALEDYPWPGNVRELESIIERAVILCPGSVLRLADKLEISSPPLSSALRTLEETERNQIFKILSETRWRIDGNDGAAAILGLNPSTLRARMHKLGIVRPGTKESD
jgi:formate hydrogenlyase transcriptional activator